MNGTEKVEEGQEVTGEECDAAAGATDTSGGAEEGVKGMLEGEDDYVDCAESVALLGTLVGTKQEQHLKMFHTTPFPLAFGRLFETHLLMDPCQTANFLV